MARDMALKEKPSKDGKMDMALYQKKLVEVYAKLKESHISPVAVTELPKKGGGGQKDLLLLLVFVVVVVAVALYMLLNPPHTFSVNPFVHLALTLVDMLRKMDR